MTGAQSDYTVSVSGQPFNDAYRYVDWLLTVPLLLIELILVMKLPAEETASLSLKFGTASASTNTRAMVYRQATRSGRGMWE